MLHIFSLTLHSILKKMKAKRRVKYSFLRLRRRSKRFHKVLAAAALVLLLLLVGWQMWPVSEAEKERNRLDMRISSYYEVSVDGKPTFYFNTVGDSATLGGGSVNKDSIVKQTTEAPGFWVNRLFGFPSCHGSIVTVSAPKEHELTEWDSDKLRRMLRRQARRSDMQLAGLEHMRNELHYYLRKHDVSDYGYNKIAAYSNYIDRQTDSLQSIVETLYHINRKAKVSVRYITEYRIIKARNKRKYYNELVREDKNYSNGFVRLQRKNYLTPIGTTTHMGSGYAMDEVTQITEKERKAEEKIRKSKSVTDSTGVYSGDISKQRQPHGYGTKVYDDGAYYEGEWSEGQRHGFGFYVSPTGYMMSGTWKNDVFKGEKLTYTNQRVYGIDISRHQHEKDSKVFPIDWNQMRIIDLGKATAKEIEGTVDYPVSFAYIKSTEGCTVTNPYYHSDYAMARKKGIRTGTYHFFSTTTPGDEQARAFLAYSKFNKGDLAPVLDVEPTDRQVAAMGGKEALLTNVRKWLAVVYNHTHVLPMLYVGQDFALKYLTHAPDITGYYQIWVARYNEYMPNLKLAIWQLSADGEVKGIRRHVDINVFNGYKSQYQEFIDAHTFK